MKVVTEQNEVTTSGDLAQSNFGIEWNSKIARMLSEQIYSDPILAVVREYTCNAWDAHTMVGTPDLPVEIHIPTALDPVWSVRDFGPGLSQAQIMGSAENGYKGLFNTYGKSGKDDSNDLIGGFGMGSKSGFAYTKQDSAFTVTSWHGGVKHCFTAHMDANGIPNIVMMLCEASSEPSGVEISIPVKSSDIWTFKDRTINVCRLARVMPKFTGDVVNITPLAFVQEGDGWKRTSIGSGTSYAVIGGIGYPIASQHFTDTAKTAAAASVYLDVPIGAVELSLSRESLSYDKRTIDYLQGRLEKVVEEVQESYSKKLLGKGTYWDKCAELRLHESDCIMTKTGVYYHKSRRIKFYLGSSNDRWYKKILQSSGFEYAILNVDNLVENSTLRYSTGAPAVSPHKDVYIVWNDTSSARIRPKFNRLRETVPKGSHLIVIKTPSRKIFNQVRAHLGWPPNFIHLNALEDLYNKEEQEKGKRDKEDLKRSVFKLQNGYGSNRSSFKPVILDFATKDTVYYVYSKHYRVYSDPEGSVGSVTGEEFVKSLIGLKDYAEVDLWSKHTIYAIPTMYECRVVGKSNFVNVADLIKELEFPQEVLDNAAKFDAAYLESLKHFKSYVHDRLTDVAAYKGTKLYADVQKANLGRSTYRTARARYDALVKVKRMLGVTVADLPSADIKKDVDFDKYPMLEFVKDSSNWYYNTGNTSSKTKIVTYIQECEAKDVSLQST